MESSPSDRVLLYRRLLIGALVLFGILLLMNLIWTAWMCDDAYISYRSVRNFVEGHGLTYNPLERVQSFTHPLWVIVLIPFYAITGEIYFTALFLSFLLTIGAFFMLSRRLGASPMLLLALVAAFCSHAFMDYSTSGLENPLTHLLLGIFIWEWSGKKRLHIIVLVASLALVNRLDTALFYFPAVALLFWEQRSWRSFKTVLLYGLPFILWETFSVFYYGFPFPNTAYAKLSTGIPSSDLWAQGFSYFAFTLQHDTVTSLVILAGIGLGLARPRLRPLGIGILLYVLYTMKVGGDFMGGRFFTAPFFLSLGVVGLFLKAHLNNGKAWLTPALTGGLLLLGLLVRLPALFVPLPTEQDVKTIINANGIADERTFYYPGTGFLNRINDLDRPIFRWGENGMKIKEKQLDLVVSYNMGFIGWYSGPENHLLDLLGLTDPLLARLPMVYDPKWRIGHYVRAIPKGYTTSILLPQPALEDSLANEYDRRLRLVTRGDLWDWNRIKQIARFNLGFNSHLIDVERHRFPIHQKTTLAVTGGKDGPRFSLADFQGLEVDFEGMRTVQKLGIRASFGNEFQVLLLKGKDVVWAEAFRLNKEEYPDGTILYDVGGLQADRAYLYPLAQEGLFQADWIWLED